MEYIFLALGFILLVKGSDFLVDGASNIARHFGISQLIVGLTIVAFGTSTPELIVNLISSSTSNTDLAISNVLGSNLFNTLIILGITSLIAPIGVQKSTVKKEIPMNFLVTLVLLVLVNDLILNQGNNLLSLGDGLILLLFFVIFFYYVFENAKDQNLENNKSKDQNNSLKIKDFIFVVLGIFMLYLGGDWIVSNAVKISESFGISQKIIGLTILATGTSLPELVTSITAVRKGNNDIAVGNVVGSNIFNILLVLSASTTITPIPFNPGDNITILVLLISTVLLWLFLRKDHKLTKGEGLILLLIYISYMSYEFIT
ncbi:MULTISPECIES: calcium/sodium antiporter [Bacteria]|jgi:cation:H+ antiporter|uniref:Calcium/sodium antiporter n=1 Tax=Geotoga petraea TaxID=28234 RepID=A0A4Z0VYL0_9BACT|nr:MULTISPECIES: calcium/sodium antiporter [Bacteria]PUU86897.1 MAG: inner membrane protein [Halanaerobium sp.]TGG86851.1 calcium/sodium antiporter [Geotoga petraea]